MMKLGRGECIFLRRGWTEPAPSTELIHGVHLAHRWKASKEQYDDRVVEVVWDAHRQIWKMLRFRDDKREGNYKSVVASIIRSIEHGVEAEAVRFALSLLQSLRGALDEAADLSLLSQSCNSSSPTPHESRPRGSDEQLRDQVAQQHQQQQHDRIPRLLPPHHHHRREREEAG